MFEPAIRRRCMFSEKMFISNGLSGSPTYAIVPSVASKLITGSSLIGAETVFTMRSNVIARSFIASRSLSSRKSCAPRRFASASLLGECEMRVTSAPIATACFTPMWPSPPRPMIPTRLPGPASHSRRGEYVVIPAHRSGAATSSASESGMRRT